MLNSCGIGRRVSRLRWNRDRGGTGGYAAGVSVAAEALEIGTEFGGGLAAEVAIFFERLVDDVFEFGREFGMEPKRRNRSAIENGFGDDAGSFAAEGERAGGHFVKNDAEREEVTAGVEFLAADLFG